MNELQTKVFALLKQVYSALGLGDEILQQHAIMLEQSGVVTAENVETVVKSDAQKSFLENMQRNLDKVRTTASETAAKNAREKAQKEFEQKETDRKNAEEEARKKAEEEAAERQRQKELDGKSEWEKAISDMKAEQAKKEKEWQKKLDSAINANTESKKTIETLQQQINEKDAAEKQRIRKETISAKAIKLGIPQSRIDEGFVIADDADDAAIDSYLATVANNWKTSHLPEGNHHVLANVGEPTKEDVSAIADEMIR